MIFLYLIYIAPQHLIFVENQYFVTGSTDYKQILQFPYSTTNEIWYLVIFFYFFLYPTTCSCVAPTQELEGSELILASVNVLQKLPRFVVFPFK